MMNWTIKLASTLIMGLLFINSSTYAGDKKPNEECTQDSDCRRGHCYTKKSDGKKVCVDCSPSKIDDTRRAIDDWCHNAKRSCDQCNQYQNVEISEQDFKTKLEAGEKCIAARDTENRDCWDGGNEGHITALKEAEIARKNCYDNFNTCKGLFLVYTCSDSTYDSKSQDVARYCERDQDRVCERWSKNSDQVDCRDIENAMNQVDKCVNAVDSLKSSCLSDLSRNRADLRDRAKRGYEYCKDVLDYKRSQGLCR